MEDKFQHFAAHPYYLMGVKAEKLRIIEILNERHIEEHNDSLALCPACVTYELLFPSAAA
jgi:hypothetical protein